MDKKQKLVHASFYSLTSTLFDTYIAFSTRVCCAPSGTKTTTTTASYNETGFGDDDKICHFLRPPRTNERAQT